MERPDPPPAAGVRLLWDDVPSRVRRAVEERLGEGVVEATSSPGGFSPGVAARLRTPSGRRVFVKAIGPEPNPDSPAMHRREADVVGTLPPEAPVPRLLWSHDDGGWVVLAFEDVDGRSPAGPWRPEELDRTLDALADLAGLLTPSPLEVRAVGGVGEWSVIAGGTGGSSRARRDPAGLDGWSARNLDRLADLEAGAAEAASGETLLHLDLRADNLLLTPDRVFVVDWPHARVGAAWVDLLFFAPSVAMQGGPPPEELLDRCPHAGRAEEDAITAVVCAISGFLVHEGRQPAPPGLPTLRAFQAAQGEVARGWLARRTGWRRAVARETRRFGFA